MLDVPLFAPWRTIWEPSCSAQGRSVDDLAVRRNSGRQVVPAVDPELLRLVNAEESRALVGRRLHGEAATRALVAVWPLVRAAVWPRWLLLESALNEASRLGALHLAALGLRTMIEELDALAPLGRIDVMLASGEVDDSAIATAVDVLQARVLPRIRPKSAEELISQANEIPATLRSERLQRAFDTLGDYVHPNYGSHVLVTHPHSVEAANTILEACGAVYESFLALPWATGGTDEAAAPTDRSDDDRHPFERLANAADSLLVPAVMPPETVSHAVEVFRRLVEVDALADGDARPHDLAAGGAGSGILETLALAVGEGGRWPVPLVGPGDRLRFSLIVSAPVG